VDDRKPKNNGINMDKPPMNWCRISSTHRISMGISSIQAGGTLVIAIFFGHISEIYALRPES